MEKVSILFTAKGQPIVIDAADFDLVKNYTWHISAKGYAVTNLRIDKSKRTVLFMHRLLMSAPFGQQIDHKNGYRNDNRRSNLRYATARQNSINRKIQKTNTSGFVGVHYYKKYDKWLANISVNYKRIHLGYFTNLQDAIIARQEAEVKYFGDFRPTR